MKINRKTLHEAIEYLQAGPPIDYDPLCPCPNEVCAALGLMEPDFDYLTHHGKILESGIAVDRMSLEDIRTMLTFFSRGERFCDGFTADIVNSGELLALLLRLDELTK